MPLILLVPTFFALDSPLVFSFPHACDLSFLQIKSVTFANTSVNLPSLKKKKGALTLPCWAFFCFLLDLFECRRPKLFLHQIFSGSKKNDMIKK
jgi:hypothetical protein